MTTVIGTAISMGLMLPATTINHQPLRTTILVGINDLILTNQRSEQLAPGTLVASHPASSGINMVLPPS